MFVNLNYRDQKNQGVSFLTMCSTQKLHPLGNEKVMQEIFSHSFMSKADLAVPVLTIQV